MKNAWTIGELPLALARDFLALRKKGFSLPPTIVLFGASESLMRPILREMASALDGVAEVKLSESNGGTSTRLGRPTYKIDLRFFLGDMESASNQRDSDAPHNSVSVSQRAAFASSTVNGRRQTQKLLRLDR